MKVTYNWLKDFVDIRISPRLLTDRLTMAGLEVTSLEERDGDVIFEIEVTSNRPDCLSVVGIAREVAAVLGCRLKVVGSRSSKKTLRPTTYDLQPFSISIADKEDCPLYTARIIRDVKVGPSPDWLKKRLELLGCRSVNNVVDITNYILFEWGQPLHAFDLDKLAHPSGINVRRAKNNEKIITIDGIERPLDAEVLLITSGESKETDRPVALAGIMGGRDTEVTCATRNILLEAALFDAIVVRRARQKLGLQSESSYRFERGLDLEMVEKASAYARDLIQEVCGGKCILAKSSTAVKPRKKKIALDISSLNKILGSSIAQSEVKSILQRLGLGIKKRAKNNLAVSVPLFRPDLKSQIDLIEEIARIYGYEKIPQTLPKIQPQISAFQKRDLVFLIKEILVGLGVTEVITYSLVDKELVEDLPEGWSSAPIEILNPLSKEQEILRPSVIPSLSRALANNLNQNQDYVNIFEIAKVFSRDGNQPSESLVLGIALSGTKSSLLQQGLVKEEAGFLHLKGTTEILFQRLGREDYGFSASESADIAAIYLKKEKIGVILRLPREILDRLDIKNKDVFVAEISLDKLVSSAEREKKFIPLPVYPGISRDISLVLKEEISLEDVLEAIKEKAQPLLRQVKVIDYYQGKQIPSGSRGLTISCLYRSDERTLTEAEINPLHNAVVKMLAERFQATMR